MRAPSLSTASRPFSGSPLRIVQGMGAGLPAGWLALSLAVPYHLLRLGGLVRPARACYRSGRPLRFVPGYAAVFVPWASAIYG